MTRHRELSRKIHCLNGRSPGVLIGLSVWIYFDLLVIAETACLIEGSGYIAKVRLRMPRKFEREMVPKYHEIFEGP